MFKPLSYVSVLVRVKTYVSEDSEVGTIIYPTCERHAIIFMSVMVIQIYGTFLNVEENEVNFFS